MGRFLRRILVILFLLLVLGIAVFGLLRGQYRVVIRDLAITQEIGRAHV